MGGITVNGETLNLGGSGFNFGGALRNVSGNNTFNGPITLDNDSRIHSHAGLLTVGGITGSNTSLSFAGPGDTTVTGVIALGGGSLTKGDFGDVGGGTTSLEGVNTYSGSTTINGGVLSVSHLADGGVASGIGQSSSAASNLFINGGTLRYTGLGGNTDRAFTVGDTATLDASGTVTAVDTGVINFTNTDEISFSAFNPTTLTLAGTNTGANTLAALITDGFAGPTTLVKNGTGTWVLTNANTFSGTVTVNGGRLRVTNADGLQNAGALTVGPGGSFHFTPGNGQQLVLNPTEGVALTLNGTGTAARLGVELGAAALEPGTGAIVLQGNATAVTSGNVLLDLYGLESTVNGTYTIINSPNGGLENANYAIGTIFNAPNLAVVNVFRTESTVKVQVSITVPQTILYWVGGMPGSPNVWSASNGINVSNWSIEQDGDPVQAAVPTSITEVILTATGATNQNPMVLGADMIIKKLTVIDTGTITLERTQRARHHRRRGDHGECQLRTASRSIRSSICMPPTRRSSPSTTRTAWSSVASSPARRTRSRRRAPARSLSPA